MNGSVNFTLFIFQPHRMGHGILVPKQGSGTHPLQRKCGVLTLGARGVPFFQF